LDIELKNSTTNYFYMNKLRILHIVPWFPNPKNKIEGIFIAEHIKALNNHCSNHVLHINFGDKREVKKDKSQNISIDRITLKPLLNKWFLKEKLATKAIKAYLLENNTEFDVVNFYITYPNAISITKLAKHFPNLKFCMMEQWSAYHNQFHLPEKNKGRKRIENIFNNNIPLFTVSNALGEDIKKFIGDVNKPFIAIPNCVNENEFNYKEKANTTEFIFTSINNWSPMKNPFVLISAIAILIKKYSNIKLVLAGDGQLMPQMKSLVNELNLSNSVQFLGRIQKNEVVNVLHRSNVYCQSSNYETFSAICLEALATGTPVLATNIGGMKDFVNKNNGGLVDTLAVEDWANTMENIYLNYNNFNKKEISINCIDKFNSVAVGELYYKQLNKVVHG